MTDGVTIIKAGSGRMIRMECGRCGCQFEVDNRKCYLRPTRVSLAGGSYGFRHHHDCPECESVCRECVDPVKNGSNAGLSTFKAALIALFAAIVGVTYVVAFI